MPKKAIFRRTNSVRSGPRSSGGGTRNNGWNCLIFVLFAVSALPVAVCLGGVLL